MSFGQWYLRRGRIDRRTYWLLYFLPIIGVFFLMGIVFVAVAAASDPASAPREGAGLSVLEVLLFVGYLLVLPPAISSQACRLHDRGHSAWWLLFNLLPFAGPIVLLVQMCLRGEPGPNRYGPPPAGQRVPDPGYPTSSA